MTEPSRAVFLSYASQDAEAAGRICAALRSAGVEVWFDQSELRGGDAWDRQIRERIHDCRLFIALIDDPAPVQQPASGQEDTTRCAPTLRVDYSRISIYPLMIVRGYCYLSRK